VPKLAIIGTIEVAPGKPDQVLPLRMAHGARCLRDEPGTLRFEVMISREDDSKLLVYEVYQDDAAFDMHRNGLPVAKFREETASMGIKVLVTRATPAE